MDWRRPPAPAWRVRVIPVGHRLSLDCSQCFLAVSSSVPFCSFSLLGSQPVSLLLPLESELLGSLTPTARSKRPVPISSRVCVASRLSIDSLVHLEFILMCHVRYGSRFIFFQMVGQWSPHRSSEVHAASMVRGVALCHTECPCDLGLSRNFRSCLLHLSTCHYCSDVVIWGAWYVSVTRRAVLHSQLFISSVPRWFFCVCFFT